MADRFEDHRGVIQDLLTGGFDSVTEIRTKQDAIRGNHVHWETTQWTYIVSGVLRVYTRYEDPYQSPITKHTDYFPGELVEEKPAVPHAWKAVTDCTVLVFTRGPRSGQDYEKDTQRLPEDEWLVR